MSVDLFDSSQPVDYFSKKTPSTYFCRIKGCKRRGVKLWRPGGVSFEDMTFACVDCAGKMQSRDVSQVNSDGEQPFKFTGQLTNHIGNMVPAIPTKKNDNCYKDGNTIPTQATVGGRICLFGSSRRRDVDHRASFIWYNKYS